MRTGLDPQAVPASHYDFSGDTPVHLYDEPLPVVLPEDSPSNVVPISGLAASISDEADEHLTVGPKGLVLLADASDDLLDRTLATAYYERDKAQAIVTAVLAEQATR